MVKKNKIIALPFAGGNVYSFKSIERHIPSHLNWITLEPPGRGNRIREDLLETIDDLADDILQQIKPLILQGNYIIYGHSMGTLLAYELTKLLIKNKLRLPMCLFLTGRGAPSFKRFEEKKSELSEDLFWKEVHKIGGLPKETLDCEDLLEFYYPILKSDFKAVEDYHFSPLQEPFSIPFYICLGKEEIGEGKDETPITSVKAWKEETSNSCVFELLEGNHFFIFDHIEEMANKISKSAMGFMPTI